MASPRFPAPRAGRASGDNRNRVPIMGWRHGSKVLNEEALVTRDERRLDPVEPSGLEGIVRL
jgi:hypothetical protein